MFVQSPNVKGAVAELEIELAATRLGVPVLKPVAEHGRYDLAFEIANRIYRVQCKWGRVDQSRGLVIVQVGCNRTTPAGYVRTAYRKEEIDLVAVYAGEIDECFLLPISLVEGRHQVQLRLRPAANGQRAFINLASEYSFHGAIAQLEERCRGTAEVAGSSPASSTPVPPRTGVIGAEEFRNRLGWYMQRAAAGEEFQVERRGRPYVRLTGAARQLRLRTELGQPARGLFVGRYAADTAAA